MTKRELHTYLYTCDGFLGDGRKCIDQREVVAADAHQADLDITYDRPINDAWKNTYQGWLCSRDHRVP